MHGIKAYSFHGRVLLRHVFDKTGHSSSEIRDTWWLGGWHAGGYKMGPGVLRIRITATHGLDTFPR